MGIIYYFTTKTFCRSKTIPYRFTGCQQDRYKEGYVLIKYLILTTAWIVYRVPFLYTYTL